MSENSDPISDSRSIRDLLGRVKFDIPQERVHTRQLESGNTHKPAPIQSGHADYLTVKGRLHKRLLDELNVGELLNQGEDALVEQVEAFISRILELEDLPLNAEERVQIVEDLKDETLGVGPLAPLIADPAVTDILVNRYDRVYVERYGKLERVDVRFRDNAHLVRIIQRIASRIGRRIDESSPMVDARLSDGSRVNATLPPVTLDGPTLSIRRFGRKRLTRAELLKLGMFSPEMLEFMHLVVASRKNVLVSGGTGAGKSTFLGAMCEAIPSNERIITIEDAAELILDQEHVIRKETRPINLEGQGRITARDLVINSLRMRPDRIIVGEVRGAEALDMLQAMNTGHDGSLTTIHANSARDAISRLETMVLMTGMELPSKAIREQIVSAIDVIVSVRRFDDGVRRVDHIAELTGMEEQTIQLQNIFDFKQTGREKKKIQGEFVSTGIVPRFVHDLRERGWDIPFQMFRKSNQAGF
ncbi:Putative conjugal transfer protein [Gimesia maris]|uniref:CpaF family protein n=1 Tax=Gimesia maris TaxID=122 RepID=UPI00118B7E71|nr:CpaF family protein [Gimesia maris]QDU16201.1 Putative conjugal transfer protein [Gimesia maris]